MTTDDLYLLRAEALADGSGAHPAGVDHTLLVIVRADTIEDAQSRAGAVFFTQSEWVGVRYLSYGRAGDMGGDSPQVAKALDFAAENGFACVVYPPEMH